MPGSVSNAAPTAVLPNTLSRAFVHSREYVVLENEYRNGESQRSVLVATSRKRWRLGKRLAPALLQQLRDFHDPTSAATQGRYTVRFEGVWEQSVGIGRDDVLPVLREFCAQILEPIRKHVGRPVIITSGYRSRELNQKVGAADIQVPGVPLYPHPVPHAVPAPPGVPGIDTRPGKLHPRRRGLNTNRQPTPMLC